MVWQCNAKFKDKTRCKTSHLTEDEIKAAFVGMLNRLLSDREFYLTELRNILDSLGGMEELERERRLLEQQLAVDAKAVNHLIAQNARVAQNQKEYQERYDALYARYEETQTKLNDVKQRINQGVVRRRKIEHFIQALEAQPDLFTEFDTALWAALVSTMTVNGKGSYTFQLTCGMEMA